MQNYFYSLMTTNEKPKLYEISWKKENKRNIVIVQKVFKIKKVIKVKKKGKRASSINI